MSLENESQISFNHNTQPDWGEGHVRSLGELHLGTYLYHYQVNKKLMKYAKKDAIFMHCLPAYRGNEVTDDVIDGIQSVVFQESENRLYVQKALLLKLL